MDPNRFYGGIHTIVQDIPSNGSDEELSDDEDYRKRRLANQPGIYIPESDSDDESDDNIPLGNIATSRADRANKPRWRDENLYKDEEEIKFAGDTRLPPEIEALETPVQYFKYLFTDEMFELIKNETMAYSLEKRPEKPMTITRAELEQFVGMCLMMSIIQMPSTRDYWSENLGHPKVSTVMACNKWEEIKRFIHFNDNASMIPKGQVGHDPLHKIRPFLQQLRARLLTVPKEEYMAVDEQIIPTKSRSTMKQYNPKKPHKWGYKNQVLSGSSGFGYDFEIYTGASNPGTENDNEPNISASSNVVVRLAKTIPAEMNYKLFFDNWYTSLPLLVYLTKRGILPLRTARANRITGYKVRAEKELKKEGREATVEKVTIVDNVDIAVTTWYDNRIVNLLSTYVGSQPMTEVRRYCKKRKEYFTIRCPKSVQIYNSHMGGVDLLDAMLGFYRIQIHSKKYYHRIFFHIMVDMVTVNAWLLYRRNLVEGTPYLPLADFKVAVSEALCWANKPKESCKRGRPSNSLEIEIQRKKRRSAPAIMASQDVRQDKLDHFPIWTTRQRCKVPECKGRSFVECQKCQVNLCLNDKETASFYSTLFNAYLPK